MLKWRTRSVIELKQKKDKTVKSQSASMLNTRFLFVRTVVFVIEKLYCFFMKFKNGGEQNRKKKRIMIMGGLPPWVEIRKLGHRTEFNLYPCVQINRRERKKTDPERSSIKLFDKLKTKIVLFCSRIVNYDSPYLFRLKLSSIFGAEKIVFSWNQMKTEKKHLT